MTRSLKTLVIELGAKVGDAIHQSIIIKTRRLQATGESVSQDQKNQWWLNEEQKYGRDASNITTNLTTQLELTTEEIETLKQVDIITAQGGISIDNLDAAYDRMTNYERMQTEEHKPTEPRVSKR